MDWTSSFIDRKWYRTRNL